LWGKRVLVTRPAYQATELVATLERLGATVILLPTIEFAPPTTWEPLEQALHQIDRYQWVIFTSANGVRFARHYLEASGGNVELFQGRRIVAIGPATARAIEALGVTVHLMPDEHVAEAVADALGDVQGQRILLPIAAQAREALGNRLREAGAIVDEVAVYNTLPTTPNPDRLAEAQRGVDIATFTSPSTVHNYFLLLGEQAASSLAQAHIACIGPITAQAARDHGLDVTAVAEVYTMEGLTEAIVATTERERL
jgi:uroporphyrinogen III methyltransferase/synthase